MYQHVKYTKKVKQHEMTPANPDIQVIDMCNQFPFGELRTNRGDITKILVRKKLNFNSKSQQQMITQTGSFLKGLRNNFLINFHHMEKEETHIYLYFEYAHLNIEKWILDLGDEMWERLKNQMFELANFLNKSQFFWTFDQKCLGLSKNISVKYYLNEFSLIQPKEKTMKSKNLAYNLEKIQKFFTKFKETHQKKVNINCFKYMIIQTNQKFDDNESMLFSIRTRESWTQFAPKTSRIQERCRSRSKLKQKIQQSKAKTYEILQKLKKIKIFSFE